MSELKWIRACDSSACVLVAFDGDEALVRDSKLGDASPVLRFNSADWRDVLDAVGRGSLPYCVRTTEDRVVLMAEDPVGEWLELSFTDKEWDALEAGIMRGEFAEGVNR